MFAYINFDINPKNWDVFDRGLSSVLSFVATIFYAVATLIKDL